MLINFAIWFELQTSNRPSLAALRLLQFFQGKQATPNEEKQDGEYE